MNVKSLFEEDLRRRGLSFSIDAQSGRHVVGVGGARMLISLANLERDVATDGDAERVVRFVDSILLSSSTFDSVPCVDRLYWSLEPSDFKESAEYRVAVSDRVDRVLVHVSKDGRLVTWVTAEMLHTLGLSALDAAAKAFSNLARTLSEATVQSQNIDGVDLGFIDTKIPFKASLILAPNLREVVGAILGWPLMAVVPDRDFLYLWAARHADFVERVGGVVVREYSKAPYPISTEVYEIGDQAIRAIGEFPKEAKPSV
jgi:uncharacterized protein YtpQ (UPF0354 family)